MKRKVPCNNQHMGELEGGNSEGYVPYDYFDNHLVEAWIDGFPDAKPSFVSGSGLQFIEWKTPNLLGGTCTAEDLRPLGRRENSLGICNGKERIS